MRIRRHNFTLVELLAAMAVFCVLLLVSMRLFSGSQRMWVRAEQKTNTFADARTAMEFVAARLQTLVYFEDVPFGMADDEIWFASAFPVEDGKSEYYLRFFKFERNPYTGKLTMKVYTDANNRKKFPLLFPPYDGNPYCSSAKNAWNRIGGEWKDLDTVNVVENVTSFSLYGFFAEKDGKNWKMLAGKNVKSKSAYADSRSTHDFYGDDHTLGSGQSEDDEKKSVTKTFFTTPPYLVEIEITMLDSADRYEQWKNASSAEKNNIVAEYGYTFRRAVLLGQRSVDE